MKTKRYRLGKSGELEVEFVEGELLEEYDKLALEAIGECRAQVTMAARFLNAALWKLPAERELLTRTLSAGANVLRYDPERVVDRYRQSPDELVRDCLHAVLHCVLHHPFDRHHAEPDTWSLASDIAAELCAMELAGQRFPSVGDGERLRWARRLREASGNLTAPTLYRVLRHGGPGEQLYLAHGLTGEDVSALRETYARDAHTLWANPFSEPEGKRKGAVRIPDLQSGCNESGDAKSGTEGNEGDSSPDADEGATGQEACGMSAEAEPEDASAVDDEALEEWNRISKQVETELRMQRRRGTSGDGDLFMNLRAANRKSADYGSFLKRFATLAEDIRVNDDEFDYVFYTYGLNRYGNMPLVEPLEYVESRRVREFVIGLDTSGSCSGRLIREFVTRTYEILRQRTSFGDEINVHIVQCDKEVRSATKVTSLRQLEQYRDSFWVSGGGGTDFKPVFAYVDSLVEQGEFSDLCGLVYFTDGYGSFPVRAPDYEVAFVFVDVEGLDVRVPPWAMKVIMTQDEILEDGQHAGKDQMT